MCRLRFLTGFLSATAALPRKGWDGLSHKKKSRGNKQPQPGRVNQSNHWTIWHDHTRRIHIPTCSGTANPLQVGFKLLMFTLKLICFLLQPFKIRYRGRSTWSLRFVVKQKKISGCSELYGHCPSSYIYLDIFSQSPGVHCEAGQSKFTSISAKAQEPGRNALCWKADFPTCIYCSHSSLLASVDHLLYQPRTKGSATFLLHLRVIPKGKQAGKPSDAICVHIFSLSPCPFPLSDTKGQLYSCSYSSAFISEGSCR